MDLQEIEQHGLWAKKVETCPRHMQLARTDLVEILPALNLLQHASATADASCDAILGPTALSQLGDLPSQFFDLRPCRKILLEDDTFVHSIDPCSL